MGIGASIHLLDRDSRYAVAEEQQTNGCIEHIWNRTHMKKRASKRSTSLIVTPQLITGATAIQEGIARLALSHFQNKYLTETMEPIIEMVEILVDLQKQFPSQQRKSKKKPRNEEDQLNEDQVAKGRSPFESTT